MMLSETIYLYEIIKAFIVIMTIGILTTIIITYLALYITIDIRERKYNQLVSEINDINNNIRRLNRNS